MKTESKKYLWPLLALALGAAAAWLLWGAKPEMGVFAELGSALRSMSLNGQNGAAWAIVIGVSLLPALGLLLRGRQKADWLLALAGAELFAMLYFLVNPTLISPAPLRSMGQELAAPWGLVSFGAAAATVAAWVLLRFLKTLKEKSVRYLPVLLFWTAVIYGFLLGFEAFWGMFSRIAQVRQGNTGGVGGTAGLLLLLTVLELIPNALSIWVLSLASGLVVALELNPFGEETVEAAERISGNCVKIVELSLLLTVLGNLLQMVLYSRVLMVSMQIRIPLFTLVLCGVLILLCQYFRRAKAVSDDNASII